MFNGVTLKEEDEVTRTLDYDYTHHDLLTSNGSYTSCNMNLKNKF